jgi:DNA polymerase-3 subunit alpha
MRYGTDQVYFKSAEEMCRIFKDFPEAIESTLEVTDKCSLELPVGSYHMPNFPIPHDAGADDLDAYLTQLTHEGLKDKIKNVTSAELDRLNEELEVIKKMKFSGYFLIVADFVKYAKLSNVLVGPGRGSSAGSLVCYALGITNVNPLKYNLLFERFLNPERVSMPDIDIDFQDDRREDVIGYSKQKYGESSVSQIVTFNKLKTKAVLKDVGRVLNYPFDTINEVTKHVPSIFGKVKSLEDCYNEIPEFKQYFDESSERKKLLNYSIVLENLNKNASLHASGVVIAPSEITDYVPVARTPQAENQYMTQYDMKMLEDAGLIKMDFLGLKELKIIAHSTDLIKRRHGINIDLESLPLDDKKTYELFSTGATIGIFQFARPKTREYLSKLKPKDINDLSAMNALNRPGPMDLIPDFIDRKYGRKEITFPHPKIEPILKETYGVIVYQEQVMQIVREVAGYTLARADIVRRAMGKKDSKLMKEQEKEFINGAVKNGYDRKTAKDIFGLIRKFADYGFNKSHSVAYSILAYYTAYLKAHFPLEFMTSLMNCRKDDMDEMVNLINEARRMKIHLSLPNINEGFADFTIDENEENRILFGLSSIKNVGKVAVDNIVKQRLENGPYEHFIDFCRRVDSRIVNKKTVESLIYAGAFDIIETNRRNLFENYEYIASRFGTKKSDLERGQSSLFGAEKSKGMVPENILKQTALHVEDWSDREKLAHEKSVLGLYLTSHPLNGYEDEVDKLSTLKFGDVQDIENNAPEISDISGHSSVRMCGVISNFKIKQSKKGNLFATFTLEDFTGQGECIVFQKTIDTSREILHNESIVCVTGRPEENGNTIKLIVDNVRALARSGESTGKEAMRNITIRIDSTSFDPDKLYEIRRLPNGGGNCNIYFDIYKGTGNRKILKLENTAISYSTENLDILRAIFGNNNVIVK